MREFEIVTRLRSLTYGELDAADRELVDRAREATLRSYAPYSRFRVGAAIRLSDGTVVTGSNQENAAFPSSLCAERTATYWAHANRPDARFEAIAIAARDTDGLEVTNPVSPCGACRQALLEYENLAGRGVRVLLCGASEIISVSSVADLLPLAFTDF